MRRKFHLTSHYDMRFSLSTCIFLLCFVLIAGGLNYSEIDRLGKGCPRLDSCAHHRETRGRQLVAFRDRNCACDHLCAEYGDCCIDAPVLQNPMTSPPPTVRCLELKQFGGVYMRDSCPDAFQGPEDIRRLCEDTRLGDPSDPLGSMPVTDSLTGLTYKNYYCGLCNERAVDGDMVLWTPRLECPLLTLFNHSRNMTNEWVVQNLATDGQSWGLFLDGENGSLFFHDCDVDPVMPRLLEAKIRPCRAHLVSECAPDWEDEDVAQMCRAYMGPRYVHGGEGYRNVHCAHCSRVPNVTHLSCQSAELRGIDIFRLFATHSFALLLDVNEGRGQRVGQVRVCEGEGEVFDPFFKKCRSLSCLPGFVLRERRCHRPNPIVEAESSPDNNTGNATYEHVSLSSGQSYNVSSDRLGKFLDCLLISLADEDYVSLPNRTLFVPKYGRLYEPTSYLASDGSVLVCSPFASGHGAKFLPVLGHVTVAGLGLSMFFLVLHFAVFLSVPDLRNLSGKNLASQCAALFFAYACFISGQFEALAGAACSLLAFLTFYFFLSSFFWMAAMAFDVWRTLRMATTELRVSSGRQTKRFLAYSLFAWAAPLLVVAALASAEYTDLFPAAYRPGFARPPCWFTHRRSLLVFFAAPLFAIMSANALLFVASARMIVMTGKTAAPQGGRVQRRNFKLYLRLALLMGLTWVVGLVAGYADVPFLFYVFVVLNTLQGLFIFVAFSCTSKVLAHLRSKIASPRPKEFKSSSVFSTKPTLILTQNAPQ